jgi:uncharacterized protein YjbI with pentapeptide repeats
MATIRNWQTGQILYCDQTDTLQEAKLSGRDFSFADMVGLSLRKADLRGTALSKARLRRAYLSGASLEKADLERSDLRDAILTNATLARANLLEADLRGAYLLCSDLSSVTLRRALLRQSNLAYAQLNGANAREADLSGVFAEYATLREATLQGGDLSRASLYSADLSGADLSYTRLRCADLRVANLAGARLVGADLTSAILYGADLRGADTTGALLQGVRYDHETQWPSSPPGEGIVDHALASNQDTTGRERATFTRRARRLPSMVRLWSFQPLDVWENLQTHDSLYVASQRIYPGYKWAYDWFRQQLKERMPHYEGHYPWWAWHGKKPPIWGDTFQDRGALTVRLELQLPSYRVLLSDFLAWSNVMVRNYIAFTRDEQDAWEVELEQYDLVMAPYPEPWRTRLETSWERIFALLRLREGNLWPVSSIQATFERLDLADVVEVTHFRSHR